MKKVLALIELESNVTSCIYCSVSVNDTEAGMYYHLCALDYEETAWELWRSLSNKEQRMYAELMGQMTGIEGLFV